MESGLKKRNYVFIVFSTGIAVISLFLALQLTPWLYAINTRVRLYLDAPVETKINICWDKLQSECVPLIPYSEINNRVALPNEVVDVWLGELPPRPVYFISLQFKSGVDKARFHELELDSTHIFLQGYGKRQGAGVNNIHLSMGEFEFVRIVPQTGDLNYFESKNNGLLIHNEGIVSGPANYSKNWMTTIFIWALLFSIYLWVAVPVSLLPRMIQNLGSADLYSPTQKYHWLIYFGCVVAGIIMVLLVVNSGVIFHQYDPRDYLLLATGAGWFNVARLPGYPLFLRLALLISGYSLDGVALLQAAVLALSVMFCLWTLRKWISPYVAFPFVLFSLFSPAQINFARWILRESLFASLVLLGVTAAIAHFTSRKPYSDRWLVFFSIICGAAFLVRENGVILPFALMPVLVVETFRRLYSSGAIVERVRSIPSLLVHYLLPVVVIGTIYAVFSTFNYFHYGHFQMEEQQTSHGFLSSAMSPANFDARALLKPWFSIDEEAKDYLGWSLYSSYILSRDQHPGLDQTYTAFYPPINKQMVERGVPVNQFNVFHQASLLNEIGKNVSALVPKRAALAGFLRQYIYILYPDDQRYPFIEIDTSKMLVFLDVLPVHVKVNLEEKSIGVYNILSNYYHIIEYYNWYDTLFILALLFSFYILKYENPVFLAPVAVFLANCALVLYSHMVAARVFVNIDVLLVLQIALGLSLWLYRNFNTKIQEVKP
jgi:hypothetical protein